MGKSGKLFKAFVAGVKAFKSPSKERPEKDKSSSKADKDHVRKGGKEKCLWSLGKSSSRNRDSLSATTAFLDSPETKSVQVENLHYKDVLPSSVSVAPDSGDASKFLKKIQDKSIASSGPLSHTREFEHEELAAIKIQAATRRYLAARQVFRALRALVRLQALVRGQRVRKQAATSLRCMQALVRVQALARGGRIRSSELGQLIQKHIQQTRQQRKKPVAEGWVSSTATLQQWQAKAQGKQDAVMKRQRALVYAFSEQLNRSTPKQSSSILALDYQPDKSHWGWVWLERWMAAQSAGISHGVAKEQRNKNDILKRRPDATLNPEEFLGGCLPLSEPVDNDSLTSTGYGNVGIHEDVPGNHAVQESLPAIEKENTIFCALEQEVEQLKDEKDEHVVFEMPTVENVPVSSSVVNRPQPSLPPPPPPPPPVSIRVVPKLSPCCPLTPPVEMVLSLPPPVSMKSVQRAPAPPPPPPPPRPPYAKTANPLVAHKSSSSECQQAACPVNVCSSQDLVGGETSSTGGMHVRFPLSAVSALSDLPSLPSVSSVSSMPIIQPVIESFPAPSIPESYHEPLLYPQVSHTTSSIMSKNGMNTQVVCENAANFIPTSSTSNFLTKTSSPSQPSATPIFSPEVLALSSQHYTVSRTPLIIPNVIEEDMLDLLEEAKMATSVENLTLTGEAGLNRVDVTAPGGGFSVDRKAGNTDQSDIDMDVDEPDDALVLKTDEAIQVTSPAANGRGDLSSASPGEKATEVVSNKHAVSPTSRQGQPTPEAVSPSVPNYMATTKSSKAKIRSLNSPTQKLDSPKQKSDSPKPRFDSSKQKVDSPKPRFDSSKQKIDSPKQKLDSPKQRLDSSKQKVEPAVRRRHSLSTLEGKVSPGTNKSAMHMRASSKGQLASLRAESTEDAACANGDSCSLEK